MHPLPSIGGRRPVLPAAHVTADSGTGVVHTAPAHGYDDFVVCKEHGIEPLCPVDERGCFTCEGENMPWAGQAALGSGTESVIGALKDAGMLVAEHDYIHSYAYDWRTKQPVLTRATQQWFADLSELQQEAADALSHVDIIPPSGRKRLGGMVSTRKEVLDQSLVFHRLYQRSPFARKLPPRLNVLFCVAVVHLSPAFMGCAHSCFLRCCDWRSSTQRSDYETLRRLCGRARVGLLVAAVSRRTSACRIPGRERVGPRLRYTRRMVRFWYLLVCSSPASTIH